MSSKENIVNIPDNPQPGYKNEMKEIITQGNNTEPEIDDPHFLCSLRKIIYKIFIVDAEIPTLPKVLIEAKNQLNFNGSKSLLRKILKAKLGFKYKNCKNNGPIPLEREKIAIARIEYLTKLSRNDSFGPHKRPVIYVDETLIYLDEHAPDPNNVWCIMLAGGEDGILDEATLVYKCAPKKKVHNLIGKKRFLKWLKQKLIPNLPEYSIVVLDNALQHNEPMEKILDFDAPKQSIIDWLQKRNVDLSDLPNNKTELLELVKENWPKNNYIVDDILTQSGHCVLRLPLYCNLSPIDNIWDLIKKQIVKKQIEEQQAKFDQIIGEAIGTVTKDDWKREMKIIKQIEQEYEEDEHKLDNETDKLDLSFGSEFYSYSSSDADYDTDFNLTDDTDDSYSISDRSYISIGYDEYDPSEDGDRLDSYNI